MRTLCLFVYKTTAQLLDRYTTRKGLEIQGGVIACERGEHSPIPKHVRLACDSLKDRSKYTAVSFAAQLGGRPLTFKWGIGKNFSYPKQIPHTPPSPPPPPPFLKSQIVGPL